MFRCFLVLTMLSLWAVFQPVAQPYQDKSQRRNAAGDKSWEERNTASDDFWQKRNTATAKYWENRNEAIEKFWRERNAAIERYQKAFEVSLGRTYLFEEDTSVTKALVSSALRDSIEPKNLINAVKVLEGGLKSGVNVNDALDVARLVSHENINVSVDQTAAFSQARQIARENNADISQSDEMLFNALREDLSTDKLIEKAKNLVKEEQPPQAQPVFSPHTWESKMKNKIQEFFAAKTPYSWGGNSIRKGVDCSGFTTIVLSETGIKDINNYRQSGAQFRRYQNNDVKQENTKFGDLIFFYDHKKKGIIGHVGIVERLNENGEVVFVHSSKRKKGIGIDTLTNASHWGENFAGIKRVVS